MARLGKGFGCENNSRGSVVTLFRFARKQGYLRKGIPTEADDLAKAKDRGGKVGILQQAELSVVLSRAPERVKLFVAIGAFTGMRSSEILRLEWRDVNFERRDAARAIGFAKSCQVKWPNNALRHSYATYRLAATANAARVALEMGNSPQKLMTNYRELADEKEAEAWFGISPQQPAKVIAVPTS